MADNGTKKSVQVSFVKDVRSTFTHKDEKGKRSVDGKNHSVTMILPLAGDQKRRFETAQSWVEFGKLLGEWFQMLADLYDADQIEALDKEGKVAKTRKVTPLYSGDDVHPAVLKSINSGEKVLVNDPFQFGERVTPTKAWQLLIGKLSNGIQSPVLKDLLSEVFAAPEEKAPRASRAGATSSDAASAI